MEGGVPTMAADVLPVAILGVGVAAAGVVSWLMLGDSGIAVNTRVDERDITYMCEGHRSVLCKENRHDLGSHILQLSKAQSDGQSSNSADALVCRAELQQALAAHCFERRFISQPEVVLLSVANVRALDASILHVRPQLERQARLCMDESVDNPGRVAALRYQNLFENPSGSNSTITSSAGKKCIEPESPLLALELRLGCGFAEVEGLPSRSALLLRAAGRTCEDDPAILFSGARSQLAGALKKYMADGLYCRIFVDGQPVHPVTLPGRETGGQTLAADLAGCSFKSTSDIATAAAALLESCQRGHGFLAGVQRLQCFAAGEQSEKIAERLLQDLQTHGGPDAVAALKGRRLVAEVLARVGRRGTGKEGVSLHEREGRSLVATPKWGPQEVSAVQRWLTLFLLGRAALDARVLLSFVTVPLRGAEADRDRVRRLRALRFTPLADVLPGEALSSNVWVCVTVMGLEPRSPEEIPQCASELEDLVRHYREEMKVTQRVLGWGVPVWHPVRARVRVRACQSYTSKGV